MSIPHKRIEEIEAEERQKFEEEKTRAYVREKLLKGEPWRRLGKTKFTAYTNAAILIGVMALVFIRSLIWLGLV